MGARRKSARRTEIEPHAAGVVAWAPAPRASGVVIELVDGVADEVIDVARVHELLALLLVRYHQRRNVQ
jgi:hypothetical protein